MRPSLILLLVALAAVLACPGEAAGVDPTRPEMVRVAGGRYVPLFVNDRETVNGGAVVRRSGEVPSTKLTGRG